MGRHALAGKACSGAATALFQVLFDCAPGDGNDLQTKFCRQLRAGFPQRFDYLRSSYNLAGVPLCVVGNMNQQGCDGRAQLLAPHAAAFRER